MADLSWLDILLRVGVAGLLGGLIGAEREADGHEAGLRTHLLLALGAGLFGLVSVGAFDPFAAERSTTNFQVDVTRVASYVAAGVGFLGAGAILKYGRSIHGLTTAASLWAAAAVGLAAGLGFWIGAVATTAAALMALTLLKPVREAIARLRPESQATLEVWTATPDAVLADLRELAVRAAEREAGRLSLDVGRVPQGELSSLVERLAARKDVIRLTLTRPG